MEQTAASAERASVKYKQVEFMGERIGEVYDGVISGVTEWGLYVEINENKCEGMIAMRDLGNDFYEFDEKNYCLIGKEEERLVLSPNESAIYNKDKKSLTLHTEKDASEEIAWRNGTLLFKSIPLQEIVRQLSNAFHTDIRIEDADLQNYHMTATFSDGETLEEILSLLCRNQKFGYTKTNDIITITQKLN